MTDLEPNNLLDGRYRIVSHLAEGGFGHTYLAEDTRRPSCPKCKEVLGVVGHYYSSRTLAAGKTYEDNQLVAIALSSSTEIENFSDYVFRTSPGDDSTAQALADHMLTKWGKKKVAIFYDPNSKYSMSLRKEFVRAVNFFGGQVVMQSDWSVENFDANHEVTEAIDRGAEVIELA